MLAQDERAARGVGAVTMVLLAGVVAFALFFYKSCATGDRVHVFVAFHQTGGLHEGSPVVVGGREVGEVEAIATTADGAVATAGIERGTAAMLATGGDVFVASRGLLGDKYLEFGAAPVGDRTYASELRGEQVPLGYREGDRVTGRDPPTMDRVMQRTWDQLQIAKGFLEDVKPEAQQLLGQLALLAGRLALLAPEGDLGAELRGLADEARRLRDVGLGGDAGMARVGAVIAEARATVAQAKAVLAELSARAAGLRAGIAIARGRIDTKGAETVAAVEDAIAKARAAIDKIDPLLAQVAAVQQRLERGEGSLGRLMKDPEFPEDAKDLGKILKREPWRIIGHPPDK